MIKQIYEAVMFWTHCQLFLYLAFSREIMKAYILNEHIKTRLKNIYIIIFIYFLINFFIYNLKLYGQKFIQ